MRREPPAGGAAAGTGGAAAGTGGAAGTGALGGAAGAVIPTFGKECDTAADCVLVSDCCSCRAEARGALVSSCGATCAVDSCTSLGIGPHEVACTFGRCVLARSCVARAVTCPALVGVCPTGTVRSYLDDCFGPCLPPTECNGVTSCSDCGAGSACVDDVGPVRRVIACVTPPSDCSRGSYCGCLEACPVGCAETDAGVGCFCPAC